MCVTILTVDFRNMPRKKNAAKDASAACMVSGLQVTGGEGALHAAHIWLRYTYGRGLNMFGLQDAFAPHKQRLLRACRAAMAGRGQATLSCLRRGHHGLASKGNEKHAVRAAGKSQRSVLVLRPACVLSRSACALRRGKTSPNRTGSTRRHGAAEAGSLVPGYQRG